MKTFKQFMLESGETGTAINPVNKLQTQSVANLNKRFGTNLILVPVDPNSQTTPSKPKPSRENNYPAPTGAHHGKY